MKLIWIFALALLTVCLSAHGQAPSPAASPLVTPAPDANIAGVLLAAFGLIKSWGSLGLWAGIAAALKLLLDGIKALGLWDKVPEQVRGLFVLAVSAATVGLGVMMANGTWVQAIGAAFGSGAGAMLMHEILKDLFGWGADKTAIIDKKP